MDGVLRVQFRRRLYPGMPTTFYSTRSRPRDANRVMTFNAMASFTSTYMYKPGLTMTPVSPFDGRSKICHSVTKCHKRMIHVLSHQERLDARCGRL